MKNIETSLQHREPPPLHGRVFVLVALTKERKYITDTLAVRSVNSSKLHLQAACHSPGIPSLSRCGADDDMISPSSTERADRREEDAATSRGATCLFDRLSCNLRQIPAFPHCA